MVTTTSATTSTASTTTSAALTQTAVDFDMFLKLLTTQMQNQDPLKPMDSTEYTQQLAQFSQVEQSVKQTSALSDILAQLSTQNLAQASSFIGKTAKFDSATTGLSAETPAQWSYSASAPLTGLTAKITDATGKTVKTATITPDQTGDFTWDGKTTSGGQAPAGAYTLALTGTTAQGATIPITITTTGRVDDVTSANGAVELGVNGAQIPMSALIKLAS